MAKRLLLYLLTASLGLGASATLTVTALGSLPFAYQWSKNGVSIAGATNSVYTIAEAQPSDSGTYTATVSNAAGVTVSPPSALVISGAVADLSKQFAEAAIAAPWTPPVAQFPQFAVIPVIKVTDPGSHWNDATAVYTVGTGEAGYYQVIITARTVDQPAPSVGFGLTAGTGNLDVKTVWCMTPAAGPNYVHFGAQAIISGNFVDGDQIRANIFTQSSLQFIALGVVVRRLY